MKGTLLTDTTVVLVLELVIVDRWGVV